MQFWNIYSSSCAPGQRCDPDTSTVWLFTCAELLKRLVCKKWDSGQNYFSPPIIFIFIICIVYFFLHRFWKFSNQRTVEIRIFKYNTFMDLITGSFIILFSYDTYFHTKFVFRSFILIVLYFLLYFVDIYHLFTLMMYYLMYLVWYNLKQMYM